MAQVLQHRRGTTAELSTQTGTVGEFWMDETKKTLVVMDGLQLGGHPLAKSSDIPVNVSELANDAGYITSAAVFSGNYNDLTNKPTLFSGAYADLTGKPTLFSGAYADLTGKPTLFSGDYNDLANKPSIPSTILDLGIPDSTAGHVLTTDGSGTFTFERGTTQLQVTTKPAGDSELSYDVANTELFFTPPDLSPYITGPAGNDSELQLNIGGSFAGDQNLTWNTAQEALKVGGVGTGSIQTQLFIGPAGGPGYIVSDNGSVQSTNMTFSNTSGVKTTFASGSTVDFTGTTVVGMPATGSTTGQETYLKFGTSTSFNPGVAQVAAGNVFQQEGGGDIEISFTVTTGFTKALVTLDATVWNITDSTTESQVALEREVNTGGWTVIRQLIFPVSNTYYGSSTFQHLDTHGASAGDTVKYRLRNSMDVSYSSENLRLVTGMGGDTIGAKEIA